jgi:hypothetical protein
MEGGPSLKLICLLAAIALVGVCVGCGSEDATTADSTVAEAAVLGCQGNTQVEPEEVVACAAGDGINVDHLRWTAWGEDPAFGRGMALVNACDPDCAAGNYNLFRVVLVATGLKSCQGTQVYGTIRYAVIEATGSQPLPGPGELQPASSTYCDQ